MKLEPTFFRDGRCFRTIGALIFTLLLCLPPPGGDIDFVLSVRPSVRLSVRPSVRPSVPLSICPSCHLSQTLCTHLSQNSWANFNDTWWGYTLGMFNELIRF